MYLTLQTTGTTTHLTIFCDSRDAPRKNSENRKRKVEISQAYLWKEPLSYKLSRPYCKHALYNNQAKGRKEVS